MKALPSIAFIVMLQNAMPMDERAPIYRFIGERVDDDDTECRLLSSNKDWPGSVSVHNKCAENMPRSRFGVSNGNLPSAVTIW